MDKKELAIVLVSGGMDSCVTAAIAELNFKLAFLHLQYGQLTEKKELAAFNSMSDYFSVSEKLICDIKYLNHIGGSSLTDKRIDLTSSVNLKHSGTPLTYVPFRNTHILSIAVSWGEVIGATKIFIGAVQEDSSDYPDCRVEYYNVFNKLIEVGTRIDTKIEVKTPIISMKKRDIVLKGLKLGVPFHLTWSCYKNNKLACGKCDSCFYRLKGFKEAGVQDPIKYF